jgi:hypothetical protein
VDDPSPEVRCRGRLGPLGDACGRPVFDSGGVWRVDETPDGGIRLVLRSGPHPGRPYHCLELDAELTRGHVTLDPAGLEDAPQPFLLRSPLHELWTSFLLLRGRGLLVHGCGLLVREHVHLFVGPSGAGKSTLAGVLADRFGTILSDDRIVIRPEAGGFRAYGTPWHGEVRFASPQSGRLAAIYFLSHGRASRATLERRAQAAASLAACSFMAGWPLQGINLLLTQCVKIVESVPCHQLTFTPDESAAVAVGLEPQT